MMFPSFTIKLDVWPQSCLTSNNVLTILLESEWCAIRSWSAACDMTFGQDLRLIWLCSRRRKAIARSYAALRNSSGVQPRRMKSCIRRFVIKTGA